MLDLLRAHYDFLKIPSVYTADICELLPTLYEYGTQCKHITELGFRTGTSFSAFLLAQPEYLVSYDINVPPGSNEYFEKMCGVTKFDIKKANSLEIEIEETDLLFVDTLHVFSQLKQELTLHGNKARKYIVMHDLETFGDVGEDGRRPGLKQAVNEFLHDNPHWIIHETISKNNGLWILKRISDENT